MAALAENTTAVKELRKARKSVFEFLPYQQAFLADQSRVLVGCWCRQAGKDFTAAAKAVTSAIKTGQKWYIVSITQRQADATFDKCKTFANAFKMALKAQGEITEEAGPEYYERDKAIDQMFRCQARTLHLPGGGSVTALPGRDPDTLAGLTGNVIFTEFGLFPGGGYDHWRVVFPLCTRGYQVIVISTPRGKNTKFYELVSDSETYSVHKVDIRRAVADGLILKDNKGLPTSIDVLKRLYNDEIGWQREFELQFSGDLVALIKWGLLETAALAGAKLPFDFAGVVNGAGFDMGGRWNRLKPIDDGRLEIGWDIARNRDISALTVNHCHVNKQRDLRALVMMEKTPFAFQRMIVCQLLDTFPSAVGCGDATGLGMDSNETLSTRYHGRWQGVTFTQTAKRELASLLLTAFDEGSQTLPAMDGPYKFIATDLYALQREGEKENLTISESDNPLLPQSHCDIAISCGLARKAGQIAGNHFFADAV